MATLASSQVFVLAAKVAELLVPNRPAVSPAVIFILSTSSVAPCGRHTGFFVMLLVLLIGSYIVNMPVYFGSSNVTIQAG